MYASAMRFVSEVMEDDHVKIGENGLLYRVSEIHLMDEDEKGFVMMHLYYAGDNTKIICATLIMRPTEKLRIYNQ